MNDEDYVIVMSTIPGSDESMAEHDYESKRNRINDRISIAAYDII